MRERVFPAVRRAIASGRLLEPGERAIAAVSGGADSIVLLHCLLRLRSEYSLTLSVVHFDHGLRDTSGRDARFVEEVAASWGLPAITGTWVREGQRGPSLQAKARQARYQFLERVAAQVGATKIALGHHRDDQAETVLLNLLRGTGLRGLRGMVPLSSRRVIRPLLGVDRGDIEGYIKAHRLSCIEDPSNRDLRYRRNRIRSQLIPVLQREYNPSITRTLARMADLVAQDQDDLEARVRATYDTLVDVHGTGICMDLESLRSVSPAIRRRLLERALRTLALGANVTVAHLETVDRVATPGGPSAVMLPWNLRAWRSGDLLYVGMRGHPEDRRFPIHEELPVPGKVIVGREGDTVEAAIRARGMVVLPAGGPDEAYLDWKQICLPLVVRHWRPGDRFRPLGLKGSKKLHDLFIDAKIPRADRADIPIVTDRQGILWVPGFRIDERGRVGKDADQVLVLTIHRGEGPQQGRSDPY